ncbi:hypothetical protein GcC1_184061 [Golovinomyces cichoracearum]|uniref:Uncharacterized protein n=1 Tax=Golovinomyces cichoracearum TaxID=62708 RepID=A0A420HL87_9PEZI|nr:hypothetical protein GcC1_184061 [Golovinomyces cichoracearum]
MDQNQPHTHDFPTLPPIDPLPPKLTRLPSTSWGNINTLTERESTTSPQPLSSVPISREIQMENTGSTLANGSPAQNPTQNHPIKFQSSSLQTLSPGVNEFLHQQAKTFQTRYSEAETILAIFN